MSVPDYEWSKEDASRIKAVWNGGGDAHMQRAAVQHLVEIICGINQIGFDPNNSHISAFNAGRRWVARQLQNAITIPLDKLVKEEPHEPRSNGVITATERAIRAASGSGRPSRKRRSDIPTGPNV